MIFLILIRVSVSLGGRLVFNGRDRDRRPRAAGEVISITRTSTVSWILGGLPALRPEDHCRQGGQRGVSTCSPRKHGFETKQIWPTCLDRNHRDQLAVLNGDHAGTVSVVWKCE